MRTIYQYTQSLVENLSTHNYKGYPVPPAGLTVEEFFDSDYYGSEYSKHIRGVAYTKEVSGETVYATPADIDEGRFDEVRRQIYRAYKRWNRYINLLHQYPFDQYHFGGINEIDSHEYDVTGYGESYEMFFFGLASPEQSYTFDTVTFTTGLHGTVSTLSVEGADDITIEYIALGGSGTEDADVEVVIGGYLADSAATFKTAFESVYPNIVCEPQYRFRLDLIAKAEGEPDCFTRASSEGTDSVSVLPGDCVVDEYFFGTDAENGIQAEILDVSYGSDGVTTTIYANRRVYLADTDPYIAIFKEYSDRDFPYISLDDDVAICANCVRVNTSAYQTHAANRTSLLTGFVSGDWYCNKYADSTAVFTGVGGLGCSNPDCPLFEATTPYYPNTFDVTRFVTGFGAFQDNSELTEEEDKYFDAHGFDGLTGVGVALGLPYHFQHFDLEKAAYDGGGTLSIRYFTHVGAVRTRVESDTGLDTFYNFYEMQNALLADTEGDQQEDDYVGLVGVLALLNSERSPDGGASSSDQSITEYDQVFSANIHQRAMLFSRLGSQHGGNGTLTPSAVQNTGVSGINTRQRVHPITFVSPQVGASTTSIATHSSKIVCNEGPHTYNAYTGVLDDVVFDSYWELPRIGETTETKYEVVVKDVAEVGIEDFTITDSVEPYSVVFDLALGDITLFGNSTVSQTYKCGGNVVNPHFSREITNPVCTRHRGDAQSRITVGDVIELSTGEDNFFAGDKFAVIAAEAYGGLQDLTVDEIDANYHGPGTGVPQYVLDRSTYRDAVTVSLDGFCGAKLYRWLKATENLDAEGNPLEEGASTEIVLTSTDPDPLTTGLRLRIEGDLEEFTSNVPQYYRAAVYSVLGDVRNIVGTVQGGDESGVPHLGPYGDSGTFTPVDALNTDLTLHINGLTLTFDAAYIPYPDPTYWYFTVTATSVTTASISITRAYQGAILPELEKYAATISVVNAVSSSTIASAHVIDAPTGRVYFNKADILAATGDACLHFRGHTFDIRKTYPCELAKVYNQLVDTVVDYGYLTTDASFVAEAPLKIEMQLPRFDVDFVDYPEGGPTVDHSYASFDLHAVGGPTGLTIDMTDALTYQIVENTTSLNSFGVSVPDKEAPTRYVAGGVISGSLLPISADMSILDSISEYEIDQCLLDVGVEGVWYKKVYSKVVNNVEVVGYPIVTYITDVTEMPSFSCSLVEMTEDEYDGIFASTYVSPEFTIVKSVDVSGSLHVVDDGETSTQSLEGTLDVTSIIKYLQRRAHTRNKFFISFMPGDFTYEEFDGSSAANEEYLTDMFKRTILVWGGTEELDGAGAEVTHSYNIESYGYTYTNVFLGALHIRVNKNALDIAADLVPDGVGGHTKGFPLVTEEE